MVNFELTSAAVLGRHWCSNATIWQQLCDRLVNKRFIWMFAGGMPPDMAAHTLNSVLGQARNSRGRVRGDYRMWQRLRLARKQYTPTAHDCRLNPRARSFGCGFECVDGFGLFHGQGDIVQAIQQAMLLKAVHLKAESFAIRCRDALRLKVDFDAGV